MKTPQMKTPKIKTPKIKTIALMLLSAAVVPLSAQWLHYPTPGIPRTPDGKPNLTAPAPKTPDGKPDLSGIWTRVNNPNYFFNLTTDADEAPMLPGAAALYKERLAQLQKGHPSERCVGHGVTDYATLPAPRRFIQTPQVIAVLYESYNQDRKSTRLNSSHSRASRMPSSA